LKKSYDWQYVPAKHQDTTRLGSFHPSPPHSLRKSCIEGLRFSILSHMTRTVLYYVAAAAFAVGAIAFGLGSQWALMGAFIAIAAAFVVVAIRSGRTNRT
jgi:hypothetical protein